ncbi:MAG: hypothetical protein JSS60_02830 [Verrucomicrobia bacterium]|nr:hypothetical protein [Verrucomicrobiota bacterium]
MKTFLSTLAGLVVVVILAAVVIGFIFWSRIPDIAASNLSKKLKVAVEIDSFGIGWGKIDVKKIQIGNPPHSILSKAFACNEIDVLAPFTNYLSNHIVIDEIDLQDVYLGLEFDSPSGTNGNWTTIMGNLKKTTGGSSAPSGNGKSKKKNKEMQQPAPTGSARSVLIHRIVLTNIDVDVVYKTDGKVKKLPRIPRMELNEISSEGGLPMDQVLNSVLGEMLKQVFIKENLKNMMQEFMNTPSPVQQYLAPFKGFFNAVPQEVDESAIGA